MFRKKWVLFAKYFQTDNGPRILQMPNMNVNL